MGSKIMIKRRKMDARCWNDYQSDKERFTKSCNCTDEDWECDYGFHIDLNNKCVPLEQKY